MTEIQCSETFLDPGPGVLGTLSWACRDLAGEGWPLLLLILILNQLSTFNCQKILLKSLNFQLFTFTDLVLICWKWTVAIIVLSLPKL